MATWRQRPRRRPPRVVCDSWAAGAKGEARRRDTRRAFDAVTFRPRHAVSVPGVDLRPAVLGRELAVPVLLAPVGYSRVMHVAGESAAARAAGAAGTGYVLSTMSGHALEDVKTACAGPVWYQLYPLGGRAAAEAAIHRARVAGYAALVVTIDTAVAGLRERDVRNGTAQLLGGTLRARLPFLPQLLTHPRWLASFLLGGGVPPPPNVLLPGEAPLPLVDVATAPARAAVTWADLRWLQDASHGPIV